MKILITGGAGFIGSHLAESLIKLKEESYVLDNLSTGSFENIKHLISSPKFHFINGSIRDQKLLEELVDECELIYHLAAVVGVRLVVNNPIDVIVTNITGTEFLLEQVSKKNKQILIASSSEVYGKGELEALKETDNLIIGPPTIPRWSYSCSKLIDEFLALAYYKEKGTPVVIARIFNTVGPRQTSKYGMVIPTFVRQALNNEPLTVHGDGNQIRCFSHVSDTASCLINLMNTTKAIGEIFNVGSDKKITILDLAKQIKLVSNSTSDIKFIPYNKVYGENFEDVLCRIPDLIKLKKTINYHPVYNLDDILRDVIAFESAKLAKNSI
ncbi:MAG: GDP-mannose 4,6-dehydratase [Candidatus Melainabacteria bacterium]|nr:GDP-mannose 4,6-dehydratase [Candidatus Melainabacteria bacterium]